MPVVITDDVKVRVQSMPEQYHGELTGKTVWHCDTVDPRSPLNAVLGRGYSEIQAVDDFVRRAGLDGYRLTYRPIVVHL